MWLPFALGFVVMLGIERSRRRTGRQGGTTGHGLFDEVMRGAPGVARSAQGPAAALLLFVAAAVILSSEPWTPAERFVLEDESVVVGYSIDEGSGWLTVLNEKTRTVERINEGNIASRTFCGTSALPKDRSIVQVWTDRRTPGYPPC